MSTAKMQTAFKVTAIPAEIAQGVRETGVSSWAKLPASTSIAKGYGPCRLCLKIFEADKDKRTFFTYNPFEGRAELPLPGPIFIHANDCERYSSDGFPSDFRTLPMLFEAFSESGEMVKRVAVEEQKIEARIDELFALPAVKFIYIRNAEAGCFMAFIDRQNGESN
jgi:Protein of unknown function (DUF1203)